MATLPFPLRLLPLLMLLLSSAPSSPALDPCAVLYRKLLASNPTGASPYAAARPSDVLPCTRTVGFSAIRDLGTLRSLINYFRSFYGLLHVARRTPDPRLPSYYDVVQQLQAVGKLKWATAEQFYSAVSRAIDGLNDGHTSLQLGCPPFLHRLALPLVAVVEGGVPTVKTAPVSFLKPTFLRMLLAAPFRFRAAQYANSKVLTINGVPAWRYMQLFAAGYIGKYHTQGQRLNSAFSRLTWNNGTRISSYGGFGIRSYHPNSDFVTMTLLRPGTKKAVALRVPFLSYTPASGIQGFADRGTYYNTFCAAPQFFKDQAVATRLVPRGTPEGSPFGGGVKVGRIQTWPKRFFAHSEVPYTVNFASGKEISAPGSYWKVYKLADAKTAVVTIHTFMPDIPMDSYDNLVAAYYFFVQETIKAFNLANRSASRVIIDVQGNGGGVTTFVPLVIELLLGTNRYAVPLAKRVNPIQMLADTDLVRYLRRYQIGYFNYSGYATMAEQPFTVRNNNAFFYPIKPYRFGPKGEAGFYSALFKNSGPTLADMFQRAFPPAFGAKPFAILSDGLCFSACSEFTMTLHVRYNVPVITVGGVPGVPMPYSAAGGGFVSEDVVSSFLLWLPPQLAALASAPRAFGVNANLAMRFCNGFFTTKAGVNMAAPIEFTYSPGNVKINFTPSNIGDPTILYQNAAAAFFRR